MNKQSVRVRVWIMMMVRVRVWIMVRVRVRVWIMVRVRVGYGDGEGGGECE